MNKGWAVKCTTIIVVLLILLLVFPQFSVQANKLDAIYFYLTRIEADIDGTTETVEYTVALAPNQSFGSGGTVKLVFPDADDGNWCRTAGTVTVAGVSSTPVDLSSTDWDIDSALPNSGVSL